MEMIFPCEIEFIRRDQWNEAMSLAWDTFLKFEARDYTSEGIFHFREFVTDETLKKMFEAGMYPVIGAFYNGRMIGMISLRSGNHVSLLFVHEKYHRKGIGRRLVEKMATFVKEELNRDRITVNAAPYGVPFYKKIGFVATGLETRKDGISYTPMEYYIG